MQKLLTKGIGHTKFKKVPWLFGKEIEIPQEWKSIILQNISEHITKGTTPTTDGDKFIKFFQGASQKRWKIRKSENPSNAINPRSLAPTTSATPPAPSGGSSRSAAAASCAPGCWGLALSFYNEKIGKNMKFPKI